MMQTDDPDGEFIREVGDEAIKIAGFQEDRGIPALQTAVAAAMLIGLIAGPRFADIGELNSYLEALCKLMRWVALRPREQPHEPLH
jgi:hypothetical protein